MTGFQSLAGAGILSFPDQLSFHLASYQMSARDSFPGVRVSRAWSWPLTSI